MTRRLVLFVPALSLALLSPACKHRKAAERETVDEAHPPGLASTLHMGDPKAASQLIAGFYGIEEHAWRWTMRQFNVSLRPPPGSPQKGAVLFVNLTVPPPVLANQPAISLTAAINGIKLSPETWSKPGTYLYQRDLPADLMAGDSVRVDFELDKAMPPNDKDARELGVVVLRIGLESK